MADLQREFEQQRQHTKMSGHEGGRKPPRRGRQRSTTVDGKWIRTDGNKRKAGEVSEESRLRKTEFLKELDKIEKQGVKQSSRGR